MDEVAKAIALRPEHAFPLPFRDLFPSILYAIQDVWQARWDDVMATAKMGELTATVVRPWPCTNVRRRSHKTALTHLRTGHTHRKHGYLMSCGVDDCLVPLTVRHLRVECPCLGICERMKEHFISL